VNIRRSTLRKALRLIELQLAGEIDYRRRGSSIEEIMEVLGCSSQTAYDYREFLRRADLLYSRMAERRRVRVVGV